MYNQIKEDELYPYHLFIDSLDKRIQQSNKLVVIIDLRNNEGNDNSIHTPFVTRLCARQYCNKYLQMICLTGRRTFSAAVTFVGELKKYLNVTIIVETTDGKANFIGEANPFRLPYCGLW